MVIFKFLLTINNGIDGKPAPDPTSAIFNFDNSSAKSDIF